MRLRIAVIALLPLLWAGHALAQYQSTEYDIERWNDDYSYLRYPGSHTDFFDPIKYVPLNASGDTYLSFGGQARYRYDYFNNSEFGAGPQDETGFDLFRFLAHADAHFGRSFRVFLQFDSSLVYDRVGGPRPGDVDDFDVQLGFADVNFPFSETNNLLVRFGRQELIYGAQRFISPNDWGNVRRSFEGLRLSLTMPNDTLDAFLVRPVIIEKSHFNSGDDHTAFAGIYNVTAFPDLLPKASPKLDAYLLLLDQSPSKTTGYPVDSDTFTLGVRPHANVGDWDFDLEANWQFGHYASSSICAYSVAAEAGYTFSKVKFTPRLSLGLDLASGSANPAHRFNQLFPPLYLYLGHLYLFGRSNLIDFHQGLSVNFTPDVTLWLTQHIFWRQNSNDAVYSLTGSVVRASDGSHAHFVGNEFDISAAWQVDRHLAAYMGWAHFFTGQFINDTGAHSDPDFFYVMLTYTF
ncbi:MAG TPA: alginate export family protein [Tepidisphaeraceae bacterium]